MLCALAMLASCSQDDIDGPSQGKDSGEKTYACLQVNFSSPSASRAGDDTPDVLATDAEQQIKKFAFYIFNEVSVGQWKLEKVKTDVAPYNGTKTSTAFEITPGQKHLYVVLNATIPGVTSDNEGTMTEAEFKAIEMVAGTCHEAENKNGRPIESFIKPGAKGMPMVGYREVYFDKLSQNMAQENPYPVTVTRLAAKTTAVNQIGTENIPAIGGRFYALLFNSSHVNFKMLPFRNVAAWEATPGATNTTVRTNDQNPSNWMNYSEWFSRQNQCYSHVQALFCSNENNGHYNMVSLGYEEFKEASTAANASSNWIYITENVNNATTPGPKMGNTTNVVICGVFVPEYTCTVNEDGSFTKNVNNFTPGTSGKKYENGKNFYVLGKQITGTNNYIYLRDGNYVPYYFATRDEADKAVEKNPGYTIICYQDGCMFYRINLFDPAHAEDALYKKFSIVRSNAYIVNLTDVSGIGLNNFTDLAGNPDDALVFDSYMSANVTIAKWTEKINNVVLGQ